MRPSPTSAARAARFAATCRILLSLESVTHVNVRVARVHTRSASDGDPGTRGGSGRCAAAAAVFSAAWRGRSD